MKSSTRRVLPVERRCSFNASALAADVFKSIGSEHSLRLLDSLQKKDLLAVVSAEISPAEYSDASSYSDDYLCSELMSKFPSWDLGIDRAAVALSKFHEAEEQCTETNVRLRRKYVNGLYSPYTPESVIFAAREKIQRLLGSFSWDRAERHFGFGPGATSSLPGRFGDAYYKFKAKPCVTRGCAMVAYSAIRRVPAWYTHVLELSGATPESIAEMSLLSKVETLLTVVEGNRVCTVPKNAKTDRTIAIEPTMNGFIQHGVGKLIRLRLKRVGIDLDDQSINQRLAYEGSLDGSLATIDLKSASDSVTLELCRRLLPSDWMEAISRCRSPVGVLPDGSLVEYQKVSSMGCGFTFELESLIFWALSSSVAMILRTKDRRLGVYGDDIIVPSSTAHMLLWILNFCGFTSNAKKTHVSGPFRESCGKHYFLGTDVTPIYIREDIDSVARVTCVANQLRRWARLSWGLDGRLHECYLRLVGELPAVLRKPSIPDGLGDIALFGDFDECTPQVPKGPSNSLHEGYVAYGYVRSSKTRMYSDVPYLLRSFSKLRDEPTVMQVILDHVSNLVKKRELVLLEGAGVPLPATSRKWRAVKLVTPQWSSYGPWWVP